jgi:antitoxin component of RelBE/YafQ-DinJ toxin-antitoxin module
MAKRQTSIRLWDENYRKLEQKALQMGLPVSKVANIVLAEALAGQFPVKEVPPELEDEEDETLTDLDRAEVFEETEGTRERRFNAFG